MYYTSRYALKLYLSSSNYNIDVGGGAMQVETVVDGGIDVDGGFP
jgi:hypothetical protein